MKNIIQLLLLTTLINCGDTIIQSPIAPEVFAWGITDTSTSLYGELWQGENVTLNPGCAQGYCTRGIYFYQFITPEPDVKYLAMCDLIGCAQATCTVTAKDVSGFQVSVYENGALYPCGHQVIAISE